MADLAELQVAIERGNRVRAAQVAQEAIDDGVVPGRILEGMTAAMQAVGRRFQNHEIYVPEMLIAARAMKESMAVLEPFLAGAGIHPEATAVIGTVRGDLHDLPLLQLRADRPELHRLASVREPSLAANL